VDQRAGGGKRRGLEMGLVGGRAGWPVYYLSIKQIMDRQARQAVSLDPYTTSREETDNISDCRRNNRSCGLGQGRKMPHIEL